ncbi:hypothetical protein M1555_02460 [Patescibacteria group bacterium]|nr:hypothetical protein [Patescibacteria group bacterium]
MNGELDRLQDEDHGSKIAIYFDDAWHTYYHFADRGDDRLFVGKRNADRGKPNVPLRNTSQDLDFGGFSPAL